MRGEVGESEGGRWGRVKGEVGESEGGGGGE